MRVEELADRIIDYRGKTPPKSAAGVPLITAKVIKGGRISQPNEFISEDTYDTWMRRGLPQQWDVLVTTEAPLGEVALLRTAERIALAQRVILIRGRSDIVDQRFLVYAFQSPLVQGRLQARATGTTVPGIKQSELRQVDVPLPPLDTQRKIAAALSAYDELVENNLRRIEILEEMAQAVFREWFVNFRFPGREDVPLVDSELGPIPEDWRITTVGDSIDLNPRVRLPRDQPVRFVPMGSLIEGSMVIDAFESRDRPSGSQFRNGDTLLARITPSLENGKTGFVQFLADGEIGCGSTEFITMRPSAVPATFVYLLARTDDFRQVAINSMVGASGRQRVQEAAVAAHLFPCPDRSLLDRFEVSVRPMFMLVENLVAQNRNLRATRDLLLPKLVSGEIDVSDLDVDTEWLAS